MLSHHSPECMQTSRTSELHIPASVRVIDHHQHHPSATSNRQHTSLHAILRQQCGSRLYVPGIAWGSDHLRLLGFEFTRRKTRTRSDKAERRKKRRLSSLCGAEPAPGNSPDMQITYSGGPCRRQRDTGLRAAAKLRSIAGLRHAFHAPDRTSHIEALLGECGLEDVQRW